MADALAPPANAGHGGGGALPAWSPWPCGLPAWATSGFKKGSMARSCEEVQHRPFLVTGRPPAVGQALYCQLDYNLTDSLDSTHGQNYRGWACLVGQVTEVLPRPPPGVFVTYADEQPAAPEATLAALRAAAPRLPPPLNSMHAAGTVIPHFGAAHGQALRARLRLSCDDEGLLEPQLGGEWGAVLFMNDEKEFMWEIRGLVPVGAAGAAA